MKKDGAITKTVEERRDRLAEWIQTCFQITPNDELPSIMHLNENTWKTIQDTKCDANNEETTGLSSQTPREHYATIHHYNI